MTDITSLAVEQATFEGIERLSVAARLSFLVIVAATPPGL